MLLLRNGTVSQPGTRTEPISHVSTVQVLGDPEVAPLTATVIVFGHHFSGMHDQSVSSQSTMNRARAQIAGRGNSCSTIFEEPDCHAATLLYLSCHGSRGVPGSRAARATNKRLIPIHSRSGDLSNRWYLRPLQRVFNKLRQLWLTPTVLVWTTRHARSSMKNSSCEV